MFKTSELYLANLNATEDLVINQGGTSSGKTIAILQALFSIAIREKCDILVVGQSIPNLKVGALKDAQDIIDKSEDLKHLIISENKTDRTFTFASGSTMLFKSFQDFQDAKSGKRDYTFFNEVNGIPKPIFDEVHLRTRKRTWVDYNPNEEFYIHDYVGKPNVKFLRTWHEHNPFLEQKVRDKIESLKEIDEELWKVYARGMTGKIEGLIFRNWQEKQELPPNAEYLGSGMDFGFTNDPTAVLDVYRLNGELWVVEQLYRTGLTNQDIYSIVDKDKKYVADSAEPKSIEELRRMGLKVEPATKGKDSVNSSIDILKRFKINIIGHNLAKEFRSYKWKVDRLTNRSINEPVDFMNHCFTGETLITTSEGLKRIDSIDPGDLVLTSEGFKRVLKRFDNGKNLVNKYSMHFDTFSLSLRSTKEHKVKSKKSWVQISKLQSGKTVYLHNHSMEKLSTYTQKKDIFQEVQNGCTSKYLNSILVQFLKAIMYTILIVILGITQLITFNLLNQISIYKNTAKTVLKKIKNGLIISMRKALKKQKSGTNQKKGLNGIVNMENNLGLVGQHLNDVVTNAEKNIQLTSQQEVNSVITTARLKHLEIGKTQYELTYDLMVEDCHEYFANGLLVHNCIDALRYFALNKLSNKNSGKYSIY